MSMTLKCQPTAVALLMSIVMVITGKELCRLPVWFFLISDRSFKGLPFFYFDKFCIWHSIQTCNLVRQLHVSDCLVITIRMY